MKNLLATFTLVAVVFLTGCQKDDFIEIIGVCPVVESTNPENSATGVALDKVITVVFNERMNPATINQASFTVRGATLVAGTYAFSDSTASFSTTSPLTPNTTYTGTLNTLVKDVAGNALQTNYEWTFVTGAAGVSLATVARFGIFAETGITSTGFSEVRNMDIGVSSGNGTDIIGFPPAVVVNGAIYIVDQLFPACLPAMFSLAKTDLTDAYLFAESASSPASVQLSGDLGGRTLTPGIYKSALALMVQNGNLTLNARGDSNAVWIFQVPGNLTTGGGAGGNIVLTGGAQAMNVFWQTGGTATIGAGTSFNGTVLALNSITLNAGASVAGRLLTRNGAVSMSTNIINKP